MHGGLDEDQFGAVEWLDMELADPYNRAIDRKYELLGYVYDTRIEVLYGEILFWAFYKRNIDCLYYADSFGRDTISLQLKQKCKKSPVGSEKQNCGSIMKVLMKRKMSTMMNC